jgi:hypothetical protein
MLFPTSQSIGGNCEIAILNNLISFKSLIHGRHPSLEGIINGPFIRASSQSSPAMAETRVSSDESPVELRQWWYGTESVIEYVSTVAFNGILNNLGQLISGPFRDLVSENSASYESLRWSELPGTNGRYRAAMARAEVMVLTPADVNFSNL